MPSNLSEDHKLRKHTNELNKKGVNKYFFLIERTMKTRQETADQ
jgi:hypothetical protein